MFTKWGIKCKIEILIIISPGIALIPQSITTAPGLIHDPFTISGWPIPTTRISA